MELGRHQNIEVFANSFFPLERRQELKQLLERTAVLLCDTVFKDVGQTYWFTDHGPNHSDAVLHYATALALRASQFCGQLSTDEALALACSCYLHDLAMAYVPEEHDLSEGWTMAIIEDVRHGHVLGIDHAIERGNAVLSELFDSHPTLRQFIPLICKAHGTESHAEISKKLGSLSTPSLRGDLLGKILLLADEMDITHHRAHIDHPQFDQFPVIARAHMFKHHYTIETNEDLPRFKILFSFPEQLPVESAHLFSWWVIGKLNRQVDFITQELNPLYKKVFDLTFEIDPRRLDLKRSLCQDDVLRELGRIASPYLTAKLDRHATPLISPNQFDPNHLAGPRKSPFYPVLDRLFQDFFDVVDTPAAIGSIEDTYVRATENIRVLDHLEATMASFARSFRKNPEPLSSTPFLITGGIGVGKSSLLDYARATGRIKSDFSRDNAQIVVFTDCLNAQSFEQVTRMLLSGLWEECCKDKYLVSQLRRRHWELTRSRIETLSDESVNRNLNGLLAELRTGFTFSEKRSHISIPVCFILDNLDRASGFETKRKTVTHAIAEMRAKGFPLFVITLRHQTKVEIEVGIDYLPSNTINPIQAIDHRLLLENRLKAAFSSEALTRKESWCEKQVFETQLSKLMLKFEDFRESLKIAIETLAGAPRNHDRPLLIPSLTSTNLRRALELFGVILKSANISEFLKLSSGEHREHYLISCAMREGFPCYMEFRSKIKNLFSLGLGDSYFGKIYVLKTLAVLQAGEIGDFSVSFGQWKQEALASGVPGNIFYGNAWSLLCGDDALVSIESADEPLPNDVYSNIDAIRHDCQVEVNSAGRYYLDWLINDLAYLTNVSQDTPVPYDDAQQLAAIGKGLTDEFKRVKIFLRYLQSEEMAERISWTYNGKVRPIIPTTIERVATQRRSLLFKRLGAVSKRSREN